MPISSRHGKWPVTYGTKIVRPGPDYRCSLCSQKHCFIVSCKSEKKKDFFYE